jgi:hypothetical protein
VRSLNWYRLSALAAPRDLRDQKDFVRAMNAYRDIAQNSKDGELAAAAAGRASELESRAKKR